MVLRQLAAAARAGADPLPEGERTRLESLVEKMGADAPQFASERLLWDSGS